MEQKYRDSKRLESLLDENNLTVARDSNPYPLFDEHKSAARDMNQYPLLDDNKVAPADELAIRDVEQDKWSKSCDFILTLIGYCVGLANIWRFPYLCAKNGGAVFLIPYLIFMVLVAFPLCYLEISLGQFSGKKIFKIWDICPILRGVGIGMTLISAVYCSYANVILSWILYYLVFSFMDPLPWTLCGQWWNMPSCITEDALGDYNQSEHSNLTQNGVNSFTADITYLGSVINQTMTDINGTNFTNIANKTATVGLSAPEEFWQYNVLRMSTGIDDFGVPQWHIILGSAVGWLITCLCIIKGVKSLGKVVYVTATVPYILITIILARALTLPGAMQGVEFYVIPNFSKLLDVQVWIQALMQIFFSLGMGCGGFICMSSYNKFNNNVLRDTLVCCIVCEGTSFYAGFVVFAVLGHMAYVTGSNVDDIVNTGPGLAFITYPDALSQLPIPQIWAVLFFLMLVMVALDTLFIAVEIITTFISEVLRVKRNRMAAVTVATCFIMFILTSVYSTNAGVYVFQVIDWYCATVSVFIFAFLECVMVGWIYGAERYYKDLEMMSERRPPIILKYLWRYVTPTLMLVIIILAFYNFTPPTYGTYVYPVGAEVLGWLVASLPVLSIPTWMLYDTLKRKGPIWQRIKDGFQPNKQWGPAVDSGVFYNNNLQETIGF